MSGCAAAEQAVSAAPPSVAVPAGPALTVTDPWVKVTGEGMTAAFGTLVNNTGAEVRVVSGTSPLSPKIELHEVVESGGKMVMRPKKGGFVIPARGTHELTPGGDHIMLMDITGKVEPGAEIPFTLTLDGGGTLRFTAIGKEFAGGKEDYQPGSGKDGMHAGGDGEDKG
ncbi:copper chaperone PCu(A)C [Spongiactinospora sp. TRM90649]|uniref:copper chaperone PCu(A)C n=1 Tax=Spongiactinospora sp. TRM90649 TaxID=3031114 RepID=UPI0023F717D9|nr:copper chaperone PCu(A)C [Spongiactinospora sp. TRM90649]MDF5752808.1 copper chaperone PCu(A)C [Spongiactinospora sp. TRM90649]